MSLAEWLDVLKIRVLPELWLQQAIGEIQFYQDGDASCLQAAALLPCQHFLRPDGGESKTKMVRTLEYLIVLIGTRSTKSICPRANQNKRNQRWILLKRTLDDLFLGPIRH